MDSTAGKVRQSTLLMCHPPRSELRQSIPHPEVLCASLSLCRSKPTNVSKQMTSSHPLSSVSGADAVTQFEDVPMYRFDTKIQSKESLGVAHILNYLDLG